MNKCKKIIITLIVMITCLTLVGCNKETIDVEPDILQIRNIVNLSTLECYYHNVAKGKETTNLYVTTLERKFWIEYTGIVKLGIDVSKVEMKVDSDVITITMPKAKILSVTIDVDSWNEDSIITSEGIINNAINKIKSEDVTLAISEAQAKMEETAKNNTTLLNSAQTRAQSLIENYINKLAEAAGKKYTIKWKYLSE